MTKYRSNPERIEACRRGDQAAWLALVEDYGRLVYSIPIRYGFPGEDAEDIMQATFASLLQSLDSLRDDTRLSAWLITTAHRECWRLRRKLKRQEQLRALAERPEHPPEEDATRWERQHLVRLGLARLGGRCEQLLNALFRSTGEPTYEQIAEELGMKVGSIGPTRARCFAKLETILREIGLDGPEETPAGREAAALPGGETG